MTGRILVTHPQWKFYRWATIDQATHHQKHRGFTLVEAIDTQLDEPSRLTIFVLTTLSCECVQSCQHSIGPLCAGLVFLLLSYWRRSLLLHCIAASIESSNAERAHRY